MKKINKKHVLFSLSAIMVTTAGVMFYPSSGEATNNTDEENIHLKVDKLDKDTLELSLTNIQDLPKSLQFTLQLGEGNVTFDENNFVWAEGLAQSSTIQTHVTFDETKKEAQFMIVSTDALPQEGGVLNLGTIDVISKDNKATAYTLKNKEEQDGKGYKYVVATTNELVTKTNFVVEDDGKLTYNTPPHLTLAKADHIKDGQIEWPQGKALSNEEKLSFIVASDDEDESITDIKVSGEVKTDVVGSYTLTYTATDSLGEQAILTVPVVVQAVLKDPVITGVSEEKVIRVGDIFNVLAGVTAADTYGNSLTVNVSEILHNGEVVELDKLFDENHQAIEPGIYDITYETLDSYGQTAQTTMRLTIKEPNPTWENVQDTLEFSVGDKVILPDVQAKDYLGKDLSDQITILGDYENGINADSIAIKSGNYTVEYRVTDDYSNEIRHKMTLIITGELKQPTISGVQKTLVAFIGNKVDVLSNITAIDHFGNPITVKASGEYIDALDSENKAMQLGEYKITYTATDKYGTTVTDEATLVIKSKAPVLTGVQEKIEITAGEKIDILKDIKAVDYLGKDIEVIETTGNFNNGIDNGYAVKAGEYQITYKVVDSEGNETKATTTLVITGELNKPVFNEIIEPIVVKVGQEVIIPTLTAQDHFNQPLEVEVSGTYEEAVQNNIAVKPGTFEINYQAIDKYGNSATVSTQLIVEEETPQIPQEIESLIDQEIFEAFSGNGSEEKPLVLLVKDQATKRDLESLVDSFTKDYTVTITRITHSTKEVAFFDIFKKIFSWDRSSEEITVFEYLMKLTNENETLYLTLKVEEGNQDVIEYLDGLSENNSTEGNETPGDTGSTEGNETSGDNGPTEGNETPGDTGSTGNISEEKPSTGIQLSIPLGIAGIAAAMTGVVLELKKRKN